MKILFVSALLALLGAAAPDENPAPPRVTSYKTVGQTSLAAHIFSPANRRSPAPAILLFHGGGWQVGEPQWTYGAAKLLRADGLVAISIEYRLSRGTVTPGDAVADACDAFAWVRRNAAELGVDPTRIGGYGVSAGGHLVAAAGLGACGDVRGPDVMLLWSPALDLERDGWFGKLMQGRDVAAISPLRLAVAGGPPTVIIQGERDTLTPLSGANAFCARLTAKGGTCQLKTYPGLGHLLTRNLANQESDFDIDPNADKDGDATIAAFLRAQGYIAK
ncbi:alpha/beta hydrolase [Sphingomonas suaedae]|uniref:Alpha/beta hydrolase n=1 Tax=Sphingomonas suaedae TaxID=2599297 RepID=A0A518RDP2_9SPHN|nr:alpha/beta hydrolase [Sphingomonas suaedae]QDX25587.1 alpha/beta hydrolase [Sphingomonas suaedae]